MFKLKPISRDAVPAALEKAVRYRLINEPMEAESICLDVLEVEPTHQDAVVTLILSLTDQFDRERRGECVRRAREMLGRLDDSFQRLYYEGIIYERQGKAHLRRGGPGGGHLAYDSLRRAMDFYEQADEVSPADNDDALLRWNACARIIMRYDEVEPEPAEPRRPVSLE